MGKGSRRSRRKSLESSSSPSSPSPSLSSSSSSESECLERRRRRKRKQTSRQHQERSSSSSKKRHHSSKKSSSSRKRDLTRDDERRRKRRNYMSSSSNDVYGSEPEQERGEPEALARAILEKFPDIATDLEQQQARGGGTFQSREDLGRRGGRSGRGNTLAHSRESQYGEGSSPVMKEVEIQIGTQTCTSQVSCVIGSTPTAEIQ